MKKAAVILLIVIGQVYSGSNSYTRDNSADHVSFNVSFCAMNYFSLNEQDKSTGFSKSESNLLGGGFRIGTEFYANVPFGVAADFNIMGLTRADHIGFNSALFIGIGPTYRLKFKTIELHPV